MSTSLKVLIVVIILTVSGSLALVFIHSPTIDCKNVAETYIRQTMGPALGLNLQEDTMTSQFQPDISVSYVRQYHQCYGNFRFYNDSASISQLVELNPKTGTSTLIGTMVTPDILRRNICINDCIDAAKYSALKKTYLGD